MDGEESSEAPDDQVGQSTPGEEDEPTASRTSGGTDDSDDPDEDRSETGANDDSSESDDAAEPDEGPIAADSGDPDRDGGAQEATDDVETEGTEDDAGTGGGDDEQGLDATEDDQDGDEKVDDGSGDSDTEEAVDDGILGGMTGPQDDREMPLAEHIEEMVKRLAAVIAVAGLVSLVVFPVADQIVTFLWFSVMPGVPSEIARPRLYGVLEKLFTEIKVASLAGLIVALPVLVYQTYAFMRPGLYPHERRYYLAAVPTSLVLAIVGVAFAYFVVLPVIFVYFLYYSQDVATIGFALARTFDLVLLMMGYLAVVFQIPLFIMLAMMMGLVTRRWLADRRLLFWGAFLGISFLFGFDPTGMAPIIVAATMIALFEGTLLLTKWTGKE